MLIHLFIKWFFILIICHIVNSTSFCGSPPLVKLKFAQVAIKYWEEALTVKKPGSGKQLAKRYCESGYYRTVTANNSIVCYKSKCKRDVLCGGVKIPDQYVGECYQLKNNRLHRSYRNGSGIPSAGYILLVDAINTITCYGGAAAYASSCLMDEETDRPILGFINVCPGNMGVHYPEDRISIGVFLHEIGHALGFSSYNFPFMRFPNGTARTPRDETRKPKYKDKYGHYIPSGRKIIPFCDTVNEARCRDAFSYGRCIIVRYGTPVPKEDRFFSKAPFDTKYPPEYFGGNDPFTDYCPTMAVS
ncbi:unnamed protein product [Schistosoma bovis]|nr:unnamed protein product [Schistosoma bovis]